MVDQLTPMIPKNKDMVTDAMGDQLVIIGIEGTEVIEIEEDHLEDEDQTVVQDLALGVEHEGGVEVVQDHRVNITVDHILGLPKDLQDVLVLPNDHVLVLPNDQHHQKKNQDLLHGNQDL